MDPAKRNKYIIAGVAFIIITLAIYLLFIFQKQPKESKIQESTGEVKELSGIPLAERPYVTLTPTSDGAEIVVSIENMGHFDKIEYQLDYLADNPQKPGEKISRGATGYDVNTKDTKYKKSILLGTASRGVRSPDQGIIDGKLTLHLFKGETEYRSESPWNLLLTGTAVNVLKDKQGNFALNLPKFDKDYWVVLSQTIGLPPAYQFDSNNSMIPVYGTFSIAPNFTQTVDLSITLPEDANNPILYSYSNKDTKWQKLQSTYSANTKTVTAKINSFATFVVVSSQ